jgi:hypothetical protein
VLNSDGAQGGGFKATLRNFSFAKQRFESEENPDRKIAITLMASVLFLTTEADDPNRPKAERDNAAEIMEVFNPADLTLYGVSTDLASTGVAFLRLVDVHQPDPSLLLRHLKRLIRELRPLFLEGRILHESNQGTVTAIILQTLAKQAGKPSFFLAGPVADVRAGDTQRPRAGGVADGAEDCASSHRDFRGRVP